MWFLKPQLSLIISRAAFFAAPPSQAPSMAGVPHSKRRKLGLAEVRGRCFTPLAKASGFATALDFDPELETAVPLLEVSENRPRPSLCALGHEPAGRAAGLLLTQWCTDPCTPRVIVVVS